MAIDTDIRQITRDKLYEIFRTPEAVRLFETILYAVRTTIPSDTSGVQINLDAHIADTSGAHQASAIGSIPSGGISSNNVQAALNELDAEKQPLDGMLTALSALVSAADKLLYFTGPDAPALATLTPFARTLLADADAATALSTLGVAAAVSTWLGTPTSANLRAALTDETGTGAAVFGTTPTLTTPVINNPTGTMTLASGVLGYEAGNGGTVTQATSKSTGVTLDKPSGEITLNAAALAAGAAVSFTLTNSSIAAGDRIVVNHMSGGTFGAYHVDARSAAGSASIVVRNLTAGSLSEAIVLGFTLLKSATT